MREFQLMTVRNSRIFDILLKLKIALDVGRVVIDGDFVVVGFIISELISSVANIFWRSSWT